MKTKGYVVMGKKSNTDVNFKLPKELIDGAPRFNAYADKQHAERVAQEFNKLSGNSFYVQEFEFPEQLD